MTLTPFARVSSALDPVSGVGAEKLMIFAPLGIGATGTADESAVLTSEAQGKAYFGASSGAEAVRFWLTSAVRQVAPAGDIEVVLLGHSAGGFTANTWAITYSTTTTASGTRFLRLGSYVLAIPMLEGDDGTAQAVATITAVNESSAPFTASNIAAVVTLTSTVTGVAAQHIPVSLDLYVDRGEPGVPGSEAVIVNNADAAGVQAALSAAQLTAIEDSGAVWFSHDNRSTAFLDSWATFAEGAWTSGNQYIQAVTSLNTDTDTAFSAIAELRNDQHLSMVAQANMPAFEIEAGLSVLALVARERVLDDRANPGMVNRSMPGLASPTVLFDSEVVLRSGGIPLRPVNAFAFSRRTVTTRIEDDAAVLDQRRFDLSILLALRAVKETVLVYGRSTLGKIIVGTGVSGASTLSIGEVESALRLLPVDWRALGWIFADTDQEARATLTKVEFAVDSGVQTGFTAFYTVTIAKVVIEFSVTVVAG